MPDRSVIAKIEGSDPRLKNEAVIISAHYDHNGADDRRFSTEPTTTPPAQSPCSISPRLTWPALNKASALGRTIIFAVWGSEERCCGPLLGSWAWVEDPLWPLEKTVAVLNMDMIGRSEEVPEGGGQRFNGLKTQTAASNAHGLASGLSHNLRPPRENRLPQG